MLVKNKLNSYNKMAAVVHVMRLQIISTKQLDVVNGTYI